MAPLNKILQNKISIDKPTILIIQKTKCNSQTIEKIIITIWHNYGSISVDAHGASGGLDVL